MCFRNKGPGGTSFFSVRDETVAIEMRPFQCDKQLPGFDRAGIGTDAAEAIVTTAQITAQLVGHL